MIKPTWAILSDYSGVEMTADGFGKFETKEAALRVLVDNLTTERDVVASKLKRARTNLQTHLRHPIGPDPTTGRFSTRDELVAAVLALYKEKLPYRLIAKRTGATYHVVYGIVKVQLKSKDTR